MNDMEFNKETKKDILSVDPFLIDVEEGFNGRKYFDATELRKLADEIKAQGVLNPLSGRRNGERFILTDGERRLRAVKMLFEEDGVRIQRVPFILESKKMREEDRLIHMVMKNTGVPLTQVELAGVYDRYIKYGYSQDECAKAFGVSNAYASQTLALMSAPLEIRRALEKNEISVSAVNAIKKNTENKKDWVESVKDIISKSEGTKVTDKVVRDKSNISTVMENKKLLSTFYKVKQVYGESQSPFTENFNQLIKSLEEGMTLENAVRGLLQEPLSEAI